MAVSQATFRVNPCHCHPCGLTVLVTAQGNMSYDEESSGEEHVEDTPDGSTSGYSSSSSATSEASRCVSLCAGPRHASKQLTRACCCAPASRRQAMIRRVGNGGGAVVAPSIWGSQGSHNKHRRHGPGPEPGPRMRPRHGRPPRVSGHRCCRRTWPAGVGTQHTIAEAVAPLVPHSPPNRWPGVTLAWDGRPLQRRTADGRLLGLGSRPYNRRDVLPDKKKVVWLLRRKGCQSPAVMSCPPPAGSTTTGELHATTP